MKIIKIQLLNKQCDWWLIFFSWFLVLCFSIIFLKQIHYPNTKILLSSFIFIFINSGGYAGILLWIIIILVPFLFILISKILPKESIAYCFIDDISWFSFAAIFTSFVLYNCLLPLWLHTGSDKIRVRILVSLSSETQLLICISILMLAMLLFYKDIKEKLFGFKIATFLLLPAIVMHLILIYYLAGGQYVE